MNIITLVNQKGRGGKTTFKMINKYYNFFNKLINNAI